MNGVQQPGCNKPSGSFRPSQKFENHGFVHLVPRIEQNPGNGEDSTLDENPGPIKAESPARGHQVSKEWETSALPVTSPGSGPGHLDTDEPVLVRKGQSIWNDATKPKG